MRQRIEEFCDDLELDVVCRQKKNAYNLYWSDDGQPLVRLKRIVGNQDEVEVFCWDQGHWQRIPEFGLQVSLDEALEYIRQDPDDLFFDSADKDLGETAASDQQHPLDDDRFADPVAIMHGFVMAMSSLGGSVGGAFSGCWRGMACAAVVGYVGAVTVLLWRLNKPPILVAFLAAIPIGVLAALGGAVGGAVNAGTGSGWAAALLGIAVGCASSALLLVRPWTAWLIGFAAGLNIGLALVDRFSVRTEFVGIAVIAILSAVTAATSHRVTRGYLAIARPHVNAWIASNESAAMSD